MSNEVRFERDRIWLVNEVAYMKKWGHFTIRQLVERIEAAEARAESLSTELERVKKERDEAKEMFWPNVEGSDEFHLYEIRNGKTEEYVRIHAAALQQHKEGE